MESKPFIFGVATSGDNFTDCIIRSIATQYFSSNSLLTTRN